MRSMLARSSDLRAATSLRAATAARAAGTRAAKRAFSLQPTPVPAPSEQPSWNCVKFEDVVRAGHRNRGGIVRTQCDYSHWLSQMTGCEIYLKHEQQQFTGSFKERGARNALLSLPQEQRAIGVMAASAGNHAQALAWHGKELGIPATVVMPTVAPMAKVEKCRAFGECGPPTPPGKKSAGDELSWQSSPT